MEILFDYPKKRQWNVDKIVTPQGIRYRESYPSRVISPIIRLREGETIEWQRQPFIFLSTMQLKEVCEGYSSCYVQLTQLSDNAPFNMRIRHFNRMLELIKSGQIQCGNLSFSGRFTFNCVSGLHIEPYEETTA